MKWIERIHSACVEQRRATRLADWFAAVIPHGATVLDVGCGDGQLAHRIGRARPDVVLRGIDVLVRPGTAVPVDPFDGSHIPYESGSVDFVLFVDVLHHTTDPMVLLSEARRVARAGVLLKDHIANTPLDQLTLRFMDRVGNARYGVALPYNYWSLGRWQAAFAKLRLNAAVWDAKLRLYPGLANWFFGRSLHFAARLEPVKVIQSDRGARASVPTPDCVIA